MDQKKTRDTVFTLLLIFVFSYLLNHAWESSHEAFLYAIFKCRADHHLLMVLEASAIDASLKLGIYLCIAVLWSDILWIHEMRKNQLFAFCLAGLVVAAITEYWNVLVKKEWRYTDSMPTLFGIGLSPMVQVSSTGVLTLWMVRRMLYGKVKC